MPKFTPIILFIALVTGCAHSTAGQRSTTGDPAMTDFSSATNTPRDTIHRFTLDNGLKVVLLEDHSAPVVAVQMWVRTGSADEPAQTAGIAHVFEHMLFKGTKKRGVGEISQDVESNGGSINAFTSFDMTAYHLSMASRNWQAGMDIIADAIQFSAFDPVELEKELEVVLEEVRRGEDNPDRVLGQGMFDVMFKVHPYSRPVIGYSETVEKLTREGILSFLHAWYRPNNMILVVAGDVPPEEFKKETEKLYASFEAGTLPERPRAKEPTQEGIRARVIRFNTERPKISIGFHSVDSSHTDSIALDILSEMLSDGVNSVLFQELRQREELVIDAQSYNYTPQDPGVFEFEATVEEDKFFPALKRLSALIHRVDKLPFDAGELDAVKARALSDYARENETIRGKAHQLGANVFYHDDPRYSADYVQKVQKLTLNDLRAVAKRYLNPEAVSIVVMLPETSKLEVSENDLIAIMKSDPEPDFSPLQPKAADNLFDRLPSPGKNALTFTSETLPEAVTRAKFSNGLTVLIREDHKAPLFSIATDFPGGLSSEKPGNQGWLNLATSLWGQGTGDLSPEEIGRLSSLIGGGVGGSVARDSFRFGGSYLSTRVKESLAMYTALLTQPTLPEKLFPLVRNNTLQKLATLKDDLFRYGLRLFLGAWYGDHPYNHLSEGTPETVQALQLEDLRTLLHDATSPSGAILSIVGDVDTSEALDLLAHYLHGWNTPSPAAREPSKESFPASKQMIVEKIDKEQTHIWWAFPGLTVQSEEMPTLDLVDTLLSGMGGRLFTRLRDELSLAYVVTSFEVSPVDPGFVVLYIAGKPEKEEIAMEEFAEQLRLLREEMVPQEELQRARNYMLGRRMMNREKFSSIRSSLSSGQRYWNDPAQYLAYDKQLEAVTAQQIQDLARRIFDEAKSLKMVLRSSRQK